MSFRCEKGNEELIRSKVIEHNLWDGAFLDTDFKSKPHVILHEVSGGTEGCSATKLKSDLLKLAKGMKKHLQKLGGSVNGYNINDARHIRVGGVQYVGNYAFSQAMCALAPDICVMWEWAANILPRSMQQMVYLDKTIRSVYAMKEIWLETKRLIFKAQRESVWPLQRISRPADHQSHLTMVHGKNCSKARWTPFKHKTLETSFFLLALFAFFLHSRFPLQVLFLYLRFYSHTVFFTIP